MTENQGEDIKLKQFLLGNMAQTDADEISVGIIADRNLDAKMSFAEEELIEDFLEGSLSDEEKELFYKNFLTTSERIELLEETALLKNYAQDYFKKESVSENQEKKSESFFETLREFLSLNLRPIAAVLIILVLAGIAWRIFLYDGSNLSPVEKDYAALNGKDLSNSLETANLSTKSLGEGTFRDTNQVAKLIAANLTENVLFRLALPAETPKNKLFNLELSKGGQAVFRQTNLRVYQNQSGQEIKVILPRSVLTTGNYKIKLSDGLSYGFVVE